MFGLGFWEIAVVVLLAVTLFPPKEIPKLARSIARAYGTVRRTAEEFRSQIMDDEDLRAPLDEVRSAYNDARWQVSKVQQEAQAQLRKAEQEARMAVSSTTGGVASVAGEDGDPPQIAEGGEREDPADDDGEVIQRADGRQDYRGVAIDDDEVDPRFADDEVDPFDEGEAALEDESDPFDEEAILEATVDPDEEAPVVRPRIPGPPPVGGKSRAV